MNLKKLHDLCDIEDLEVDSNIEEVIRDPGFCDYVLDFLSHLIPVFKLMNDCQDSQINVVDDLQL